jgi:hypothetical protein
MKTVNKIVYAIYILVAVLVIALIANRITMETLRIIGASDGNVTITSGLLSDSYRYETR